MSYEKFKKIAYPTERHRKDFYRKISAFPAWILSLLNVHPDYVILTRVILLFIGFYFFYRGTSYFALVGALVFELCIIFDTFDGALARYYGISSKKGEHFDFIADHLAATIMYFASVGVLLYNNGFYGALGMSFFTIVFSQLFFFLRIAYRAEHVSMTKARREMLFRFFYQDNGRWIVNMIMVGAILSVIYGVIVLYYVNILFLLFSISKLIYLAAVFYRETGIFPFTKGNLRRIMHFVWKYIK